DLGASVLEKFRGRSIPIDTVGVGTTVGATIPTEGRGGFGRDILKDSSGKPVRTRLEPKNLSQIAEGTGGSYYTGRFDEVGRLASRIVQGMEFGKLTTTFTLERDYFPILFLIALVAFSLEYLAGRWDLWVRAGILAAILSSPALGLD